MQWAEAGIQMISWVAGQICLPRNFGGRGVFWKNEKKLATAKVTRSKPLSLSRHTIEDSLEASPDRQDHGRPLANCSARLVYSHLHTPR